MKKKLYFYTDITIKKFIIDLLIEDFELLELPKNCYEDLGFKNKNILYVTNNIFKKNLNPNINFFSNNNVVAYSSRKKNNENLNKYKKIKTFFGPLYINKFQSFIKNNFNSDVLYYKDLKIFDDKIKNISLGFSQTLTELEKNLLVEFINKKQLRREYILESVLKLNKNIETKTIESHLTRIRKKIFIIKSDIQIFSKGDVFYLDN